MDPYRGTPRIEGTPPAYEGFAREVERAGPERWDFRRWPGICALRDRRGWGNYLLVCSDRMFIYRCGDCDHKAECTPLSLPPHLEERIRARLNLVLEARRANPDSPELLTFGWT